MADFCQRRTQTRTAPGENELLGATQVASSCNCFPKRPIIIMLSVHSLHPPQVNKNRAMELWEIRSERPRSWPGSSLRLNETLY